MTNSLYSKCKRCGKEYSSTTCPFCTVTGLDIEALIQDEGLNLKPGEQTTDVPVALIDTVSGKIYPVVIPICKVGRDLTNDIVISGDRSLSRFHFQIRVWGDEFFVEDCGSRNGTFLNGSPISTPRQLHNGDVVSAGMSRYRFSLKLIGDERGRVDGDQDALDELMGPGGRSHGQEQRRPEPVSKDLSAGVREVADLPATRSQPGLRTPDAADGTATGRGQLPPSPPPARTQDSGPDDSPDSSDARSFSKATGDLPLLKDIVAKSPESADPEPDARVDEPRQTTEPADACGPRKEYPEWSATYVNPDMAQLLAEKKRLLELMDRMREELQQLEQRMSGAQSLAGKILCAKGDELSGVVREVLSSLGWTVDWSAVNPQEMSLKRLGRIEAVVRLYTGQKEPPAAEVEGLINQQAVVWCQYSYEPKGIIVLQLRPDLPPNQRPGLNQEFSDNMSRRKIAVLTTPQLVTLQKMISSGSVEKDYLVQMLLTASGPVSGLAALSQIDPA